MNSVPLILVAEDEAFLHIMLDDELTEAGFEIVLVNSGNRALAELDARSQDFALLLTDIRMGAGADGWAVARRARELLPNIPVVYMTGDSAADWSAYGVPNSLMLAKPFAPAQLVTAVAQLLNAAGPAPVQG